MNKHVQMNYSKITPNIFLGTNACCIRHFDIKLLKKGITADISLQKERIDTPRGVKYFLWLPTVDKKAPSHNSLDIGSEMINTIVLKNEKIYIHCLNGHGRSPTLVAAYFIKYKKLTVRQAISKIKDKRKEIHLMPVQKKSLEKYSKRWK